MKRVFKTRHFSRWMRKTELTDRANIAPAELEALQNIAHELLARTGSQLDLAVSERALEEICLVH